MSLVNEGDLAILLGATGFFGLFVIGHQVAIRITEKRIRLRLIVSLFEETDFLRSFWAEFEADGYEPYAFTHRYHEALWAVLPNYYLQAIFKLTDGFEEIVSIEDLAYELRGHLMPGAWERYRRREIQYYQSLAEEI